MFGEFLKRTDSGVLLLTNMTPYWTALKFIPETTWIDVSDDITPGCKVHFDGHRITKSDFDNCQRCHMQILEGKVI